MKKIIVILALVVVRGSVLFAQDAIFKKEPNTKLRHVYGYVYHWDGHHWKAGGGDENMIIFRWWDNWNYYNQNYEAQRTAYEVVNTTTGYYEFNENDFDVVFNMYVNYGVMKLSIGAYTQAMDYTGNDHVDIYIPNLDAPLPSPDNTIPTEN